MKKLLEKISKEAVALQPDFYSESEIKSNYIGRNPATEQEIETTEKRLGIKLPNDVVEFYKTSNGTSVILDQCFGAFEPLEKIDWLKNAIPQTIEDYCGMGEAYTNDLKNSIIIAGINYVHMVLIIQPYDSNKEWRYWEFAHYVPGETPFHSISNYLERLDDFLSDQNKNKAETEK